MNYKDEDDRMSFDDLELPPEPDRSDAKDLYDSLALLQVRISELEERVARLETGAAPARRSGSEGGVVASPPGPTSDLVPLITEALSQLGEADVGAIRQQLVKQGLAASLSRSDVNRVLYARKDLFEIASQEQNKPLWRLAQG